MWVSEEETFGSTRQKSVPTIASFCRDYVSSSTSQDDTPGDRNKAGHGVAALFRGYRDRRRWCIAYQGFPNEPRGRSRGHAADRCRALGTTVTVTPCIAEHDQIADLNTTKFTLSKNSILHALLPGSAFGSPLLLFGA